MRLANPTFKFSHVEKADLAKALLLTSLAFAIFFLRTGFVDASQITFLGFVLVFGIAALTAGVGFILHELCHKLVAHHFRVHGEFRANSMMLYASLLFAFFGFIIAAPGAVYMSGRVSKKESGIIAAAGPVANVVLAILFAPLALYTTDLLRVIGSFGVFINALLGAFNLIPIPGFDGAQVFRWNKAVYLALALVAAFVVVGAFTYF